MQQELDAAGLPVQVVIHGVNGAGYEVGNTTVTTGRDIPWLQDTSMAQVWTSWNVTYRDVIILDEQNLPYAVYNLTTHNLADPAQYADLKALFVAAATD